MTGSCSVSVLVISGKLDQILVRVPDIHRGDSPMRAGPADRAQTADTMLTERGNHIIQRIPNKQTQVSRAGHRPVSLEVNLMTRLMNIDLCAQVSSISRLMASRADAPMQPFIQIIYLVDPVNGRRHQPGRDSIHSWICRNEPSSFCRTFLSLSYWCFTHKRSISEWYGSGAGQCHFYGKKTHTLASTDVAS